MTIQNDNDGDKKKKTNRGGKPKSKEAEVVYRVPRNVAVLVAKGDLVGVGQQLSEGNIDLHDLYKQAGRRATEKYIIESIQKIYTAQGANIHDKHTEIVVRQMFSRARIQKIGDSDFVPGEIIEIAYVVEQNERLKKAGKNPATFEPELLGVTKAALASSSFLSAASFQETSRVLIDTAVMGREDHLVGLKENVIIGKIIPAGTGYRRRL
jgi:DNA-directed RNA polymerase subunit beta'